MRALYRDSSIKSSFRHNLGFLSTWTLSLRAPRNVLEILRRLLVWSEAFLKESAVPSNHSVHSFRPQQLTLEGATDHANETDCYFLSPHPTSTNKYTVIPVTAYTERTSKLCSPVLPRKSSGYLPPTFLTDAIETTLSQCSAMFAFKCVGVYWGQSSSGVIITKP